MWRSRSLISDMTPPVQWRADRRIFRALRAIVLVCALAGPAATRADDASPVVTQEKLLKDQAVSALTKKDPQTLFMVMDQYRALESTGAQIPAGLFFAEADAARGIGDPVRAERAFNDFFRIASPEGAAFAEAMRAYNEFRASLAETTWPILEDMVPITGAAPSTASPTVAGTATPGVPQPQIAPFSLAQRPVTRGQFAEFVAASGYQLLPLPDDLGPDCRDAAAATDPAATTASAAKEPAYAGAPTDTTAAVPSDVTATVPSDTTATVSPDTTATVSPDATATVSPDATATVSPDTTAAVSPDATAAKPGANDPMTCVGWTDAIAYVDWLRNSTGVKFRLPLAIEWEHAARSSGKGGLAMGEPAWEWVADCAVTSGIDVTPESTIEADRASCRQRVVLTNGATTEQAQALVKSRESRAPHHRASNLGFRLAL